MKKQEIDGLEKRMRAAFHSNAEFIPPGNWRKLVMDSVRRSRNPELRRPAEEQAALPLRFMWRFSAALVIAAVLICLSLYLLFPGQTATAELSGDIPFDSFDKYIITVAQL